MAPSSQVPRGEGANLPWLTRFYEALLDYKEGWNEIDEFKANLEKLGFPKGYIDWLAYMVERE